MSLSKNNPTRMLIVCLGNSLTGDDAVGALVFQRLSEVALPPEVRLEFLGTAGGLALIELLQGEQLLVIVDAVQLGGSAGTIHRLQWEALPQVRSDAVSSHDVGLRQALQLSRRLQPEKTPERVALFGVEGQRFDVGQPSPEVLAAIEELVSSVRRCATACCDTCGG